MQNHWQDQGPAKGPPLHPPGALVRQEDQGNGEGDEQVRLVQRGPVQQVREEGADQVGLGHVKRGTDVQDA